MPASSHHAGCLPCLVWCATSDNCKYCTEHWCHDCWSPDGTCYSSLSRCASCSRWWWPPALVLAPEVKQWYKDGSQLRRKIENFKFLNLVFWLSLTYILLQVVLAKIVCIICICQILLQPPFFWLRVMCNQKFAIILTIIMMGRPVSTAFCQEKWLVPPLAAGSLFWHL